MADTWRNAPHTLFEDFTKKGKFAFTHNMKAQVDFTLIIHIVFLLGVIKFSLYLSLLQKLNVPGSIIVNKTKKERGSEDLLRWAYNNSKTRNFNAQQEEFSEE